MHPRQLRLILVIVGCVAALLWSQFGPRATTGATAPDVSTAPVVEVPQRGTPATAAPPAREAPTPSRYGTYGFRSPDRLVEHFEKHGAEFGARSAADYLAQAQALRDAPVSDDVLEATRSADGVISRYRRSTGAFLAFDADGTIRTFFKPNDGERYFRRQLTRRPQ